MENKELCPQCGCKLPNHFLNHIHTIDNPQLDWREPLFQLISKPELSSQDVAKITELIAEVEKLAYENGRQDWTNKSCVNGHNKKRTYCPDCITDFSKELRSSLKTELVEAGEKMKLTEEGLEPFDLHSVSTKSRNRAISDYQDIIKSA